jgi:hypothetical protein
LKGTGFSPYVPRPCKMAAALAAERMRFLENDLVQNFRRVSRTGEPRPIGSEENTWRGGDNWE